MTAAVLDDAAVDHHVARVDVFGARFAETAYRDAEARRAARAPAR